MAGDSASIQRADRIVMITERLGLIPKRCLDVGCGSGYLLQQLQVQHWSQILGLALDGDQPDIEEVAHDLKDATGTFDLITCVLTIDRHPERANTLVPWMINKLEPGGTLIIETTDARQQIDDALAQVEMKHARIDIGGDAIYLVGNRYAEAKVEKVFYSFDSPDLSTKEQYINWLQKQYGKKMP